MSVERTFIITHYALRLTFHVLGFSWPIKKSKRAIT